VAVDAPAATFADAGTVNRAFAEATPTVIPAVAGFDNVAVQLVVAGATIVVGVQESDVTVLGAATGIVI
jgi:hypothetical protein